MSKYPKTVIDFCNYFDYASIRNNYNENNNYQIGWILFHDEEFDLFKDPYTYTVSNDLSLIKSIVEHKSNDIVIDNVSIEDIKNFDYNEEKEILNDLFYDINTNNSITLGYLEKSCQEFDYDHRIFQSIRNFNRDYYDLCETAISIKNGIIDGSLLNNFFFSSDEIELFNKQITNSFDYKSPYKKTSSN